MMTNRPRSYFEKFLFENQLAYSDAGKLFGCTGSYIHAIATGKRKADSEVGAKILGVLCGRVSLDDLRRDAAPVPPRPRALGCADAPAPSAISPVSADGAFSSHSKGAL